MMNRNILAKVIKNKINENKLHERGVSLISFTVHESQI